jgi:antirestriction protein ArdC
MPPLAAFRDAESYYAILGHEAVHNAVRRIMPRRRP